MHLRGSRLRGVAHVGRAAARGTLRLPVLLLTAALAAVAWFASGAAWTSFRARVDDASHIRRLRSAAASSIVAATQSIGQGREVNVARRALVLTPVDDDDDDDDDYDYYEDEKEEEEPAFVLPPEEDKLPPPPVIYRSVGAYQRLAKQVPGPGHLAQRRWLRKGKAQGYVTVPFTTAVRSMLQEPDVNLCLVGRRETSDKIARAWEQVIDDLPPFEIVNEADAPEDLDPLEPEADTPLDEPLPEDAELRDLVRLEGMRHVMSKKYWRSEKELEKFIEGSNCKILRQVVAGLPKEYLAEPYRETVRATVLEVVKQLWTMAIATNAKRLRWRLACTEGLDPELEENQQQDFRVRAYFILAGEALEFVPQQFIDRRRVQSESSLSADQIQRQSSEDWAMSVSADGTNISEALKRVPAGWTTFLKGDAWPGNEVSGAVHRLPQTGKRLFLQVDFLEAQPQAPKEEGSSEEALPEDETPSGMKWLGPMAGIASILYEFARRTPPFRAGQERRKEVNAFIQGITRAPEILEESATRMDRFEQNLWMDFEIEEAPVVLLVGGNSYTGRAISRKLVTRGYHVAVLQKPKQPREQRVMKTLPQGVVISSVPARTEDYWVAKNLKEDIFDAVTGVDKIIICDADKQSDLTWMGVKNVLSAWQLYRQDFAEMQRSFTAKVALFNFEIDEHFELWDVERQRNTDTVFGAQRCGWTRSEKGAAMFAGQFNTPFGQSVLKSPKLKLNLQRFSGLHMQVYNQAYDNKYVLFVRTSDFDESRIQYEFEFEVKASTWRVIRMPFSNFVARRCDGTELPQEVIDANPLRRQDVCQVGVLVRTPENEEDCLEDKGYYNPFRLKINYLKVFRAQPEPQVVYLGSTSHLTAQKSAEGQDDSTEEEILFDEIDMDAMDFDEQFSKMQEAEEQAAAAVQEVTSGRGPEPLQGGDDPDTVEDKGHRIPVNAVLESGLACTIVWVNKLNEHPGGKFPIAVRQTSIKDRLLSASGEGLGSISRGDAAELVVSALLEPACLNAEFAAGEKRSTVEDDDAPSQDLTFEISSTMQENVKDYLRQLTPNK